MSIDPKLVAAISAAVGLYIDSEQEALMAEQRSRQVQPPVVMSSPYAMAGRMSAMNIRWTWQMRLPR